MDTQNLKQRNTTPDDPINKENADFKPTKTRDNKKSMAKRGLKSLAVAVALPLSMTLLTIYLFGSGRKRVGFGFPSLWFLHIACLGSTIMMGLSSWLVWADGGFHKRPTALFLYLAQFGLSLVWDPVALRVGSSWGGLAVSLGMFGALFGCHRVFKQVNPIAGDFVKPCLAWAAILTTVNLKMAFV